MLAYSSPLTKGYSYYLVFTFSRWYRINRYRSGRTPPYKGRTLFFALLQYEFSNSVFYPLQFAKRFHA